MSACRGLVVDGAEIRFGARPGLCDVKLSVARGERLALLGPSGSGKTSLLRAIAGLHEVTEGAIVVDGRDVTRELPERRGTVYMHQSPSLFAHLTVIDNVGFPLEVRGTRRAHARDQAAALLDRVRLGALALRAPHTLSGGQRHRVALARALAANPAVLLLDEPFASLDPELRVDVRQAVLDLIGRDESAPAVVLVTHDVDEAAVAADRVAILLDGRLAQIASPEATLNAPASVAVARFLGLPNVLPGTRISDGIVTFALGRTASGGRVGPVTVVVRASGVRVDQAGRGVPARVVSVHYRVAGALLHLNVNGQMVVGVPTPGMSVARGDRVDVTVDLDGLHVIDDADEARVV